MGDPCITVDAPITRKSFQRSSRTWDDINDCDLSHRDLVEMGIADPPQIPNVECAVSLPGREHPGKGCGDLVKVRCNDCGCVFEVEQGCGLRTCPRCYKKWARREACAATEVTRSRWTLYPGDHLIHAMVSIPGIPENIFRDRKRAIKIGKKHGLLGFSLVPHHTRENDQGHHVPDGYNHYHLVGVVSGVDGFDTLPDLVERDFIAHDGRVAGKYDWTFKVIRQRGNTSWYVEPGDLVEKYYYQLEHAAIQHRKHALTWAGTWWDRADVDANKIGGEGEPGNPQCPKCGGVDTVIVPPEPLEREMGRYQKSRIGTENLKDMAWSQYRKGEGPYPNNGDTSGPGGGVCYVEAFHKKGKDSEPHE